MWAPYAWFAFSQARSFLYHRRNGYTLEDESLEEITSGLIQTNVLRLDLGVVPCEVVQAEITGLPAVVRVGPNQWSWAMSVVRYAMSSESRTVIRNG